MHILDTDIYKCFFSELMDLDEEGKWSLVNDGKWFSPVRS